MASEKASEPPTARGIALLTVHIPSALRENAATPISKLGNRPSRWSTPEFYFYYLAAFFAIPAMFWIPISLSQSEFRYFLLSLTLNYFLSSFTSKLSFLRLETIAGLDKWSAGGEYIPMLPVFRC